MQDHAQWVAWGPDPESGRAKCPLIIGATSRRASSTDPATWRTFSDAAKHHERHAALGVGAGYVFTPTDGLVFLDFDHCLDDVGALKTWARPLVVPFVGQTYVERSPSGHGLHVFARGNAAPPRSRFPVGDGSVEVYTHARYSTVTGDIYQGSGQLAEAQNAIDALIGSLVLRAVPSAPLPLRAVAPAADAAKRAAAYIASMGPSIEGQHGDDHAFRVAATLRTDFALSEAEARSIFWGWNKTCQPPWTERDLERFMRSAAKNGKHPQGAKLLEDRPRPEQRNGKPHGATEVSAGDVAETDGLKEEPLSKSYASACRVLRDSALRETVLGTGRLEFDETTLMPTIDKRAITPEAISGLREQCELKLRNRKGEPIQFAIENLQAAVLQVAHERPYHPVKDYLSGLAWDGMPRLDLLPEVLGAVVSPLNRAMLRKFMISAVARALNPGCKVDTALILVGPQGLKKSSFFRALAGTWFSDTPMNVGDKDSLLTLRAAWIIEWAELESMQRAARMQTVKAFLSSSEDLFRAPYERTTRRYPRSCVIVGSTNDEQFLTDPTGGRRYWVVPVSRRVDVTAVEADRDQLWSEAVHAYRAGELWYLTDAEEGGLRRAQQRHEVEEPWEDEILRFAGAHPEGVTTAGVLDTLRVPAAQQTKATTMRVAAVLTRAGFQRRRATINAGTRAWVYLKASHLASPSHLEAVHA
jgi:hypothetical protein